MPPKVDILGKGWKFPPELKNGTWQTQGSATAFDFEEMVNQRFAHVMGTMVGERVPRRSWGSFIKTLLFSPIGSDELKAKLQFYTSEALESTDDVILITSMEIDESKKDRGELGIVINYTESISNLSGVFVYPFNTRRPTINLNSETQQNAFQS